MGHKLGASRGSYFDYHDIKFAEDHYKRAIWTRIGLERIEQMENELVELRKMKDEHEKLKKNGQQKREALENLLKRVEELEKKQAEKTQDGDRRLGLARAQKAHQ